MAKEIPESLRKSRLTKDELVDLQRTYGRKVNLPHGRTLQSTWYTPPKSDPGPSHEMGPKTFQDHVNTRKREYGKLAAEGPVTPDKIIEKRSADSTLDMYLKTLGRTPSSAKAIDWGAAEAGRDYTPEDLRQIQSAEGKKVTLPNGKTLQSTWYRPDYLSGNLTGFEQTERKKAEQAYLKSVSDKIAARQKAEAEANGAPKAEAAPAAPAKPDHEVLRERLNKMSAKDLRKVAQALDIVDGSGKTTNATPADRKGLSAMSVDALRRNIAKRGLADASQAIDKVAKASGAAPAAPAAPPSPGDALAKAKADLASIEKAAAERAMSDDRYATTGRQAADNKAIDKAKAEVSRLEGPKAAPSAADNLRADRDSWAAHADKVAADAAAARAKGLTAQAAIYDKQVAKFRGLVADADAKLSGERPGWSDEARAASAKARGVALPGEAKPEASAPKKAAKASNVVPLASGPGVDPEMNQPVERGKGRKPRVKLPKATTDVDGPGKNYPGIPETSPLGKALRGPKGAKVAKAVDALRGEIGKALEPPALGQPFANLFQRPAGQMASTFARPAPTAAAAPEPAAPAPKAPRKAKAPRSPKPAAPVPAQVAAPKAPPAARPRPVAPAPAQPVAPPPAARAPAPLADAFGKPLAISSPKAASALAQGRAVMGQGAVPSIPAAPAAAAASPAAPAAPRPRSLTSKALGVLGPVGMTAAVISAARDAASRGEGTSGQVAAAGQEAAVQAGTMAAFGAATMAGIKGIAKLGVRAASAVPLVQGAMIAGGAAYGAATAKPGERLKGAVKGGFDMSLPGMVWNTGAAVKDAVGSRESSGMTKEQAAMYAASNAAFEGMRQMPKQGEQAGDGGGGPRGFANPTVQFAAQQARGVENVTPWAQGAPPAESSDGKRKR
jgi:uncharacterized protein YnzC (UPF0291/DUF896 family)